MAAKTLYEFYTGKGQALPSLTERGKLFEQYGLGSASGYQGTADQNTQLLGKLSTQAPASDTSSYVSEVKDQLGSQDGSTKGSSSNTQDAYGLEKLRTTIEDSAAKKEAALNALKTKETELYDTEYEKAGLADKKQKISDLDSKIAAEREKRDASIADIKKNPNLSAAQMTGDIKKIADYQNNVINNYISERNGVANEYNTGLADVDKAVSRGMKDYQLDYSYWSDVEKSARDDLANYTKLLREDLSDEQKQSNFEKELAQNLEIAKLRAADTGSTTYRLITDPVTGDPLYWVDPKTMNTFPAEPGDTQDMAEEDTTTPAQENQDSSSGGYWSNLWNAITGKK
jgi:hypothetical protein